MRKWENLDLDVLLKIFKELNLIQLASASQVCRSWRLACSDSFLWDTLDLGLLKSNFVITRVWPYIYVDRSSDKRLSQVLRTSLALSCGNITCIIFHFHLFMQDNDLIYLSERSPHLKRLVLPAWDRITKHGISQAACKWKDLESITVSTISLPICVIEEVGQRCKNISQLKVMDAFDAKFASLIAINLPRLKVLSIRCSKLTKDALLFILDNLVHLEVLNISHCILLEGSSSEFTQRRVIRQLDSFILEKASRLRTFVHCQKNSCITCNRMLRDKGSMKWNKYEDWIWRRDEVSSLDIDSIGKILDAYCLS